MNNRFSIYTRPAPGRQWRLTQSGAKSMLDTNNTGTSSVALTRPNLQFVPHDLTQVCPGIGNVIKISIKMSLFIIYTYLTASNVFYGKNKRAFRAPNHGNYGAQPFKLVAKTIKHLTESIIDIIIRSRPLEITGGGGGV